MQVLRISACALLFLATVAEGVTRALLVIDMQTCFIDGTLPVAGGLDIIPGINELLALEWNAIVFSEDYHPFNSISFASVNGEAVDSFKDITYDDATGRVCGADYAELYGESAMADCAGRPTTTVSQYMWPDHCIQGTLDGQTHASMNVPNGSVFVKKGFKTVIDSYGVFGDNLEQNQLTRTDEQRLTDTENALEFWLKDQQIREVYVVGLAFDFCVKYSALQSQTRQFKTFVVEDLAKSVNPASNDDVRTELTEGGVTLTTKQAVLDMFAPDETVVAESKALLVIDMQNCFLPGGTLAVTDGDLIIDNINSLSALAWEVKVFTEDYHPFDHISFASAHPGKEAFENTSTLVYNDRAQLCGADWPAKYGASALEACEGDTLTIEQALWPDHCVQGTDDQQTNEAINIPSDAVFVKKGFSSVVDAYGAFANNFEHLSTGRTDDEKLRATENALESWLNEANVKDVYIVGLAYDVCVKFSAIQAKRRGYNVFVVEDATKPVFPVDNPATRQELLDAGVTLITTEEVVLMFAGPPPLADWIYIAATVGVVLLGVIVYFVTSPSAASTSEGAMQLAAPVQQSQSNA